MLDTKGLFTYRKHWAHRFGTAPFLPTTRAEMDALGWDSCDVVVVTGDAYVDHPSFGMAIIGRLLEAQGFRVGIIAQPDWSGPAAFEALGRPELARHAAMLRVPGLNGFLGAKPFLLLGFEDVRRDQGSERIGVPGRGAHDQFFFTHGHGVIIVAPL